MKWAKKNKNNNNVPPQEMLAIIIGLLLFCFICYMANRLPQNEQIDIFHLFNQEQYVEMTIRLKSIF